MMIKRIHDHRIDKEHLEELGFYFTKEPGYTIVNFDGYPVSILYPGYIMVESMLDSDCVRLVEGLREKLLEVIEIAKKKKYVYEVWD